ncbi:hypothetical protein NQZ68_011900 [Dissostichus eleginoides]|nr:hypothetical protein NQZ68_011900 [Dissostichus eleginoides]
MGFIEDQGRVKELERAPKENPGTKDQVGTRSSERGDEEQERPGRWLDVAGGAAGVWIWDGKEAGKNEELAKTEDENRGYKQVLVSSGNQ